MAFRNGIAKLSELIADSITGASIVGGTITGAFIRTAASGKRWEIKSSPANQILGYSGNASETAPGSIVVDDGPTTGPTVTIKASTITGLGNPPQLILDQNNLDATHRNEFQVQADTIEWSPLNHGQAALFNAAGFFLGTGSGHAIRSFDFGAGTYTITNASGEMTVLHGLSVTPSAIVVTPGALNPRFVAVTAKSASSFTVRVWDNTGTFLANGSTCPINWWAVG